VRQQRGTGLIALLFCVVSALTHQPITASAVFFLAAVLAFGGRLPEPTGEKPKEGA